MKASDLIERLRGPAGAMFASADRKEAADLIEAQAKAIEELREALDWAISEIEGRTRYDTDRQFGACLAKANEALASHSKEGEQG